MLTYEFHPLAEKELDEAVAYYEALEPGKGRELLQQIQAAIEQARQFPESAPISRGLVRSLVVQPSRRDSNPRASRKLGAVQLGEIDADECSIHIETFSGLCAGLASMAP